MFSLESGRGVVFLDKFVGNVIFSSLVKDISDERLL